MDFNVKPSKTMAETFMDWCRRQGLIDIWAYDLATGTRYALSGEREQRAFRDNVGHVTYDLATEGMDLDGAVGVTAEGHLNHTLHYGTDRRLLDRLVKFLARYGYTYRMIDNCFYMLVKGGERC